MKETNTPGRALAMLAGLAFTAGGLTILLGPALLDPQAWASYHVLTMLTVFGTIAAGHLFSEAGRARHWLAALGFLVLFFGGTALVVYQSVGRQAEAHDTIAMEVETRNGLIADKQADLAQARDRLSKAETNADRERGSKCKSRCRDWENAAADARHVIAVLESEVKALGAPRPVNAKAAKAAEVAAVFGFDRNKAAAAFSLLEPFLLTLFFEIGSIVSLGYAFRRTALPAGSPQGESEAPKQAVSEASKKNAADTAGQSDYPALTDGSANNVIALFSSLPHDPDGSPDGSGGGGRKVRRERKAEIMADIRARHERGERFASQEDLRAALAGRFGPIAKSSLSDWLGELSGEIVRRQDGRRKAVG